MPAARRSPMFSRTSDSIRYSRLSRISRKTRTGKMMTITQAPSVNFTIAKIATTIAV